jgi:uncharacterized membrane protein
MNNHEKKSYYKPMPSKYDTNPLDPDFPEKVSANQAFQSAGAVTDDFDPTQETAEQKANGKFETKEFKSRPAFSVTEDETRRFATNYFGQYSQSQSEPLAYGTSSAASGIDYDSSRKVGKIGISEKVLIGLPYLPISIGLVSGLLMLLFLPKEENKVRFHAAQGFAANVAVFLIAGLLNATDSIIPFASETAKIFGAVTTIILFISAIRAWQGKPVHLESVEPLTNYIEEKIGPVKIS